MSVLRVQSVSRHFSGTYILEDVNWQIPAGTRWGLVGRNGAGKTTLLRIIAGELEASAGTIWKQPGLRMAVHRQLETEVDPTMPARQAVAAGLASLSEVEAELEELHQVLPTLTPESEDAHEILERLGHLQEVYQREGGYSLDSRIERALGEIGLAESSWDKPMGQLSGGQRTRVRLARLWLSDPDLLLLDEPTNHLDLETTEWLEERLENFRGTMVLISHDRAFLDALVDHVAEVENKGVTIYEGDYTTYQEEKAERLALAQRAYETERKDRARVEDFIRRNLAGQKTKQAKSRRKQLERRKVLARPATEKNAADLRFFDPPPSGEQVLIGKGLTRRYGDHKVIDAVNIKVMRGEHIGIVGPNGCGKTTLLKMLAGRDAQDAGELLRGSRMKLAYYDQRHDTLESNRSVLDEIWTIYPLETQETMRTFLGRFDFRGDEVFRPVSTMSGGEKSRLALAKLILSGANVLLQDEPTNHLDLASQERLAQALTLFTGTLLLVSHDRYLLDQLVDKLWIVGGGKVRVFDGTYSEWRERREAEEPAAASVIKPPQASSKSRGGQKSPESREKQKAPAPRGAALKKDGMDARRRQKQREKLEGRIEKAEKRKEEMQHEMADPEHAMNWVKLGQMQEQFELLKKELDEHYARWAELAED